MSPFARETQLVRFEAWLNCPFNSAFNRMTLSLAESTCRGHPLEYDSSRLLLSAKENLKSLAFFGILEHVNESSKKHFVFYSCNSIIPFLIECFMFVFSKKKSFFIWKNFWNSFQSQSSIVANSFTNQHWNWNSILSIQCNINGEKPARPRIVQICKRFILEKIQRLN